MFRPFRGEVLDGVVCEVTSNGIMIESGPLKSFISKLVNFSFKCQTNVYRELKTALSMTKLTTSSYLRMTQTTKSSKAVKLGTNSTKSSMTKEIT